MSSFPSPTIQCGHFLEKCTGKELVWECSGNFLSLHITKLIGGKMGYDMTMEISALNEIFVEFYYWITVPIMFLIHLGFCLYEVSIS